MVLRNFDFFLKVHEALIIIITPPPPRALMTGQLFGSIQWKESQKACPLRQKWVRFSLNQSKEATHFCLRQRHGGKFHLNRKAWLRLMGLNGSFHSTQITTKHDFNPRSATHDFSLWETPNGGVKQQLYGCVRLALSLKKVGCSARSTQIAFFSSENVGCLIFEEKGDFVKLRCYSK